MSLPWLMTVQFSLRIISKDNMMQQDQKQQQKQQYQLIYIITRDYGPYGPFCHAIFKVKCNVHLEIVKSRSKNVSINALFSRSYHFSTVIFFGGGLKKFSFFLFFLGQKNFFGGGLKKFLFFFSFFFRSKKIWAKKSYFKAKKRYPENFVKI